MLNDQQLGIRPEPGNQMAQTVAERAKTRGTALATGGLGHAELPNVLRQAIMPHTADQNRLLFFLLVRIAPDEQTNTTQKGDHQTNSNYTSDDSFIHVHKAPPALSTTAG
ncbi:hypothetical protein GCM10007421_16230 [Halopseudomonas oceani]|nr:hypothetical protein GCM10007421_16230 [Halopseudomonas oceani]